MSRYVVFAAAISLLVFGCANQRPGYWEVPLSPDDAFTLASLILTQGNVRGCGSFEVTDQYELSKDIIVECDNGSTKVNHTVSYWPESQVDGRGVADSAWDKTWLSTAYCVKAADGKWDLAFLDLSDAHDRARELSRQSGKPTVFYAADSLFYWETRQNETGEWVSGAPTDEVSDRDLRSGCELEKSPL